ncbi:MAG: hypothetical protein QGF47_06980 [Arenicellales bacterium]|nr:hypothetical protein [Arenicellales bacterium]
MDKEVDVIGPPAADTVAQSLRRASWVCIARPSEPSPPAVDTAMASAGVDAPAIGA